MRTAPGTEAASAEPPALRMIRRGQLLRPLLGWTRQWRREANSPAAVSLEARTRSGEGRRAPRSV